MEPKSKFDELREDIETLQNGKGIMTILMNLAKQQEKMSCVLQQVSGKRFDIVLPNRFDKGD